MSISCTLKATSSHFGEFLKLLFCWKGSTYKLLYKELIVFVVLYALLSLIYWWLLTEEQKHLYSKVSQYCGHSTDLTPMSSVLGFHVTLIVNRWWAQYTSTPLPDQFMCVIPAMSMVAEQIINPFGEDDDAFETNKLINRNLWVSLLSVDDMYQNLLPAMKDKYWNKPMA